MVPEEVVEVLEAVVEAAEVVEAALKLIKPEIVNTVVDIVSSNNLNTQEVAMIHTVNSSSTLNMGRKILIMRKIIMVRRRTIKKQMLTISNSSNNLLRKQHTEK